MPLPLALASIGLALVFLAGPVILLRDARQRRLLQRITLSIAPAGADKLVPNETSIRREQIRFQRLWDALRTALLFDPQLRDAYVLQPWLTFALAAALGLAAGGACARVVPAPWNMLLGGATACVACRLIFGWQRGRYIARLQRQLPDALQFVVSAVGAGFPVLEAIRGLTREAPEPTRSLFTHVLNEVALGQSLQQALLNQHFRTRVPEYAIFAVTLSVQNRTGGHLAGTIQKLAETVRDRLSIAARAKALAGEGTVSATILSILPVLAGVALTLIQPGYLSPLFHDPRGQRLLLFAVGALLSGIWMMRRMILGVVRE